MKNEMQKYLGKLLYIKFFPNGSTSVQYEHGGSCTRGNTVPLGNGIIAHVRRKKNGKQYAVLSQE